MYSILTKRVSFLLLACACILIASCTPVKTTGITTGVTTTPSTPTTILQGDSLAASRQATLDAVSSLLHGHTWPAVSSGTTYLTKAAGWFDVNDYFTVLKHLSMEPGYTLDYLYYCNGSGAQPTLYARKIDAKPFATLSELEDSFGKNATHVDPSKAYQYDYLLHVKTDDTPESYFEYAALRVLGGQFYLWWHAGYSYRPIICNRDGLESMLKSSEPPFSPPDDVNNKARLLDYSPKVEVGKDTASVRVVTFNSWEGFIEQTYLIQRSSPHLIQDVKKNALVAWRANVTF